MASSSAIHIEYLADYPICVEEVAYLKYEQWRHTSPDRPYDVWIDEIRGSARKDKPPITLIAVRGDLLLGFVSLIEIDERAGIENGLWVITLYVKAPYRRRGVGSELARRCTTEGQRLGRSALYLWTESADLMTYYARRGWHT